MRLAGRRIRGLAAGDRGYTVPEMLVVVTILGTVMGGLTALFVQASNAELDMNRRFQAQVEARLALDKLRREVHCANKIVPNGPSASITVTLGSQCKTGSGDFTWCSVSLGPSRFGLYRKGGTTCDSGGVRWADYLTVGTLFNYTAQSTTSLATLHVDLPVDVEPNRSPPVWELEDDIVLRNTTRTTPT